MGEASHIDPFDTAPVDSAPGPPRWDIPTAIDENATVNPYTGTGL
jgi:hypothetical protein